MFSPALALKSEGAGLKRENGDLKDPASGTVTWFVLSRLLDRLQLGSQCWTSFEPEPD